MIRKILIPVAVVALATLLGVFVLGRGHVAANSSAMENSGIRLTAAESPSQQAQIAAGRTLFVETCSSCHGVNAQGSSLAPQLQGVGGAAVDLWLSAGWMPLATPGSQAEAKPARYDRTQILQIVAYVTSIKPGGVSVPGSVDLTGANRASGFDLFSLNCAPCHTITGAGDAIANGYHAPPLHGVTPTMVYEAIRTGPQNMPVFSPQTLTPAQLKDVVAYVTIDIEHPANPGGLALGGVGPVAEGFVGLFVGVGACLLAAFWVGDRTEKDEEEHHSEEGVEGAHV
jgi:ubiquinol-cytochrome c reductase cytochrome c subunit